MRQYFNWKSMLVLIALLIVGASIYFTNRLARQLADEERKNVKQLAEGIKTTIKSKNNEEINFATNIILQNKTIPLILTDENGNIIDKFNIDTSKAKNSQQYLLDKLAEFKKMNPPIISDYGSGKNYVYYGESYLLTQLRYFPYIQLSTVILFIAVVLIALSAAHRSLQNQVWVGLSKETAHQLGTPLSSIEAWMEMLKEHPVNKDAVTEMQKDIDRLKLVADRFSKVGSAPKLEEEDLVFRLQNMVNYMQRRAPKKINISLRSGTDRIPVNISGPLFDWVIENLIRNSLDALAGEGKIEINVTKQNQQVWVDIQDNGKGIPRHQLGKVFTPGFTTKKRGWGLGLSLAKRIIDKYHHGSLFVKQSEPGKGTTFRIILKNKISNS